MSGLCGWNACAAGADPRAVIVRMASATCGRDGVDTAIRVGADSALACARRRPAASIGADGPMAAAAAGRPRFEDPRLADLAERHGPEAALLDGYRRLGPDVLSGVRGAFAFAVVAPDRVFLATDRLGICPVFLEQAGAGVLFGSDGRALDAHPAATREANPQALFDYVYFGFVPAPGSVRPARQRLLPGQYAICEGGNVRLETYWRLRYGEDAAPRPAELEAELRDMLRTCVRSAAENGSAGTFLSGGLDSSTVSGVLAEVREGPARAYSIGFDAEGYDELGYAREAAKHFGLEHREYYVTPKDVAEILPAVAELFAEPFGNESVVPAYYCARMAREDGTEVLLAGDGGDEIFGGNERYAKQKVFALWGRLPARLRRALLEPVVFGFPFGERIWPVRKARRYVEQANLPMPHRLQSYNLLETRPLGEVFTAGFLAAVDPDHPRRLMRRVYEEACAGTMLDRMLAHDMKFTLADCDLPKVSLACELAGIDVRYPLLDERLVEFAARLRPELKVRRFRLRHFFKRALRDFLPRATLTKRKHGFGLPFGVWLRTDARLQALAEDSLRGLKGRAILEPSFVDEALAAHRSGHAAFYGAMIWGLVMLEQWHRAHLDRAPTAVG